MRIYNKLNAKVKTLALFDDNEVFTEEYLLQLSKVGFDTSDLKNAPNNDSLNISVNDSNGGIGSPVSSSFPHGGYLRDKSTVEKGNLYTALVGDKYVDVLCITSGAWVYGTNIPDNKFKVYDYKNIKK